MAVRFKTPLLRVFSGGEKDGVSVEQGHAWIVEGLRAGRGLRRRARCDPGPGEPWPVRRAGRSGARHHRGRGLAGPAGQSRYGQLPAGQSESRSPRPPIWPTWPAYVHLKDFRRLGAGEQVAESYTALDGAAIVGTVIGAGDVDLPAVLTTLREAAGYMGWLSIEYEGRRRRQAGAGGEPAGDPAADRRTGLPDQPRQHAGRGPRAPTRGRPYWSPGTTGGRGRRAPTTLPAPVART